MSDKKKIDISIDLETFGISPDQVVLCIGACAFDIDTGVEIDTFEVKIDWASAIASGRVIDAETLRWWMQQDDAARKAVSDPEGAQEQRVAVFHFFDWIKKFGDVLICPWGNGVLFDVATMESLFRTERFVAPWNFRDVADMRTLVRIATVSSFDVKSVARPAGLLAHRALDDARYQTHLISAAWQWLRNGGRACGCRFQHVASCKFHCQLSSDCCMGAAHVGDCQIPF